MTTNVKVSALPPATTPYNGSEYALGIQNGSSVKVPVSYFPASNGSTLIGTIQSGTGSVTRTVASKLNDTVSVKDFGAIGNGVTDDTAAIQAAMDSGANSIYFPSGTYVVSSAINIPSTRNLYGDGPINSTISTNSATANIFNINTPYACGFTNLRFTTSVTRTGGSYIQGPSSVANSLSIIHRCVFGSAYIAIDFQNMALFEISNCYIAAYVSKGVIVSCPLSPDTGDSTIFACIFDGSTGTGTAIYQSSSGGLRVTNNKFLGGSYHYFGDYNTGATATSILMLQNNSSEHAGISNFAFNETGNTSFSSVIITGNQISIAASASAINVIDTGILWMNQMVIGANTIGLGNSSVGMSIGRMFRGSIYTNSFFGNGTLTTGINFSAGAIPVTVYPQDFFNIATPYAGTLTGVTFTANTGTFTTLTSSSDAVLNGVTVGKGGGAVSTNTAIGNLALNATASGVANTAIGRRTLFSCLSGNNNVAVGNNSLQDLTTGSWNVALGVTALQVLTTGNSCTGVGFNANLTNVSGNNNVAVGYNSLLNSGKVQTAGVFVSGVSYTIQSIGSTDFTLIGASANTVGVVFTASGIGTGTGTASPNNGNNIGIGYASGGSITTGSNNVVIGSYNGAAAPISATGSNYIVLSDGAANVRQTIDPNGHAIFGATTRTAGYLVATLPTGVTGMRAYVTNALTPAWGATVVTGGAVTVPVFYNGSNWIVG